MHLMRHALAPKLRLLIALSLVLVIGFGAAAWEIVAFGNRMPDSSADAAIVLGAAAWGSNPSPVYRERINEAISLYKQGRVHWIIFTGGSRRPGYPSEAEVGRQFSAKHGIPLDAMLVDSESRNTWQNLDRARKLMAVNGIRSALLVSDPLHMRRAMAIAIDLGIRTGAAPTPSSRFQSWTTRGKFLWRETWLYIDFLFFGHSAESTAP
jgi:uncharacterized SAM-binding protein YcdF (DUF218 family)